MTWLPPDQTPTRKWPVVGERHPLNAALDPARWSLTVDGAVERPLRFDWAEASAWPRRPLAMDVHCVTRWSRRQTVFEGRPLSELLEAAGPAPDTTHVRFVAWSMRDHDTSLPLALAREMCWLVTHADGAPLEVCHGGPMRVVTPGRYFYKSLKWVRRVELCTHHPLGYWEREDGYHDGADPWPGDQRYISGSLDPAGIGRLRAATQFTRWQRATIRRADLRGWRPLAPLGAIRLKGCDLRGADLSGQRLIGANLSLSDLRGASLRGADLRDADLEGVWFEGADLREADLRGAFLTATTIQGARVDQARFTGAQGLLPDARTWLAKQPVGALP